MAGEGWISIHRQIVDSDIYQMPPLYLRVFERLLIEANHQNNEIPYKVKGGKTIGKKLIRRGERLTSVRDICNWVAWYERGKLKEPNPKTIQNILDWLEENDMIKIYGVKGNRKETHYSIVNYNVYQSDKDNESNSQVTEKKQSADTNNNVNNDNNNILPSDSEGREKLFKTKIEYTKDDKEYLLASYLSRQISKRLEVPEKDEKTIQSWAYEFNKMVRLDKHDIDEMKDVLVFSQRDSFWQDNIMSAGKFRKQYLVLLAKSRKEE